MSNYSVNDWISQHGMAMPDKLAAIDLASNRRYTYSQMNNRVGRLANHLKYLGITKGDRVAYFAFNSTDVVEIIFACWRIGAVAVALNFRLTARELTFIIEDSTPKLIFVDSALGMVWEDVNQQTDVPNIIILDGVGGDTIYEKVISSSEPLNEMIDQILTDQCMLMYSSGTTGRPKGVIITHGMMLFSAVGGMSAGRTTRDSVSLVVMPLFHIAAVNVSCCPMVYMGGCLIVMRMFDPDLVLKTIGNKTLGVTHIFLVPAAYNALKDGKHAENTDFTNIVSALSGAETVPMSLVKWWSKRGICLQEGWGMTETSGTGCLLLHDDVADMVGSAGRPLMGNKIRIVDEKGKEAPPNVLGEIQMKGPAVTPGYWNRPKANEESFSNGWFKTGDIGKKDSNGYIFIEDRLKDMYISGGENVYPAEVENILYELEEIKEVAIIGIPNPKWGEVGCAVVCFNDGKELTLEEIRLHCAKNLANYKIPSFLVGMEILPRSATGKVLKFELRQTIPAKLNQ